MCALHLLIDTIALCNSKFQGAIIHTNGVPCITYYHEEPATRCVYKASYIQKASMHFQT